MSESEKISKLLAPRIKIENNYPNSPFKHYEIIENPSAEQILWAKEFTVNFRFLQWHEERTIEEMPEYVKTRHGVYKVSRWSFDAGEWVCFFDEEVEGYKDWTPQQLFALPCTEQDFINYQSKVK